jgi:hypothetical protein
VAQLVRLAQILNLERQRRRAADLYCENGGQRDRGHFTFAFAMGTGDLLASSPFSVSRRKTSFFGPCFCCSIQPLLNNFSKSRSLGGSAFALIQPAPRKYCMNWRSGWLANVISSLSADLDEGGSIFPFRDPSQWHTEHRSPLADGCFTSIQLFANYGGGSSRFRQCAKPMPFLWRPWWSGPADRHFDFAFSPSSTRRRMASEKTSHGWAPAALYLATAKERPAWNEVFIQPAGSRRRFFRIQGSRKIKQESPVSGRQK